MRILTILCIVFLVAPYPAAAQEKDDDVPDAVKALRALGHKVERATKAETDSIRGGPIRSVFAEIGLQPHEYRILTDAEAMQIRGGPVRPLNLYAAWRAMYTSPPFGIRPR